LRCRRGCFFSILKIGVASVVYLTLGLTLAGLAGQFVMSYLSDAIGRRGSGTLCGFSAAIGFALAGYYFDTLFGTVSVFWLLMMVASFFGLGSMAIVRPYTAEVWPAGLRASGMGLASGFGSLCGLLTPRGPELITGAPSFLSPQATPDSVLPATLLLATWSALAGLVFWLFAIETRGRSIGRDRRGARHSNVARAVARSQRPSRRLTAKSVKTQIPPPPDSLPAHPVDPPSRDLFIILPPGARKREICYCGSTCYSCY